MRGQTEVGTARARQRAPVVNDDPLLLPSEAAAYIGVSPQTLANWRAQSLPGRRIDYLRVSNRVRYRKSTLDLFLAARECAA